MAERLAPEHAPEATASRPESVGRSRRRWPHRVLVAVAILAVVGVGSFALGHLLLADPSARTLRASALLPDGQPARVLVVLAHPGQELEMAGTLQALDRAGATVFMLCLTRGEAQGPTLAASSERLAGLRADELADAAQRVGVDSVVTLSLPDGGLLALEEAAVTAPITRAIRTSTPSVVLTVEDLTGADTDSQVVARYAVEAAQAGDGGVSRVWSVTRAPREARLVAALGADLAVPLPAVDASVVVGGSAVAKGEVLAAHGTQSPDLARGTYPFAERIPAWAYFRFLDRESFHLSWGEPLRSL